MRPKQALHLIGAAVLVSRGMRVLQAAPAVERGRSAAEVICIFRFPYQ